MARARQLAVVFLALAAAVAPLYAASFSSTTSGNWSSAATWGGAGVPGAGDSATINAGNTVTLDVAVTVDTLTQSGTLTGAQPLTVTTYNWNGGTQSGSSSTTVNGSLTIAGGTTLDTRSLTLASTATISGANTLIMQNNAQLVNNGTLTFSGDGTLFMNGTVGTTAVTNNGTIQKSGGTSQTTISVPIVMNSGAQLLGNSGQLNVGTITATGSAITAASGATIDFYNNTTRSFDATSSIGGAGTIIWASGTNTVSAAYNVTGATTSSGGTTTVSNAVSIGTITMSGGTLTLNSASALSVPTLTMNNGILNGTAPISVTSASMAWSAGTIGGSGALTVPAGTTVTITSVLFDTRPVTNNGTFAYVSNGGSYLQNNASITNNGTMDIQANNNISLNAGTASIVNNGTIQKSGGAGLSSISVPLTMQSASQFLVESGTVDLGAVAATGASFSVAAGTTLDFLYTYTRTFDAASSIGGAGTLIWGSGTNTVDAAYNITGTTTSAAGATTTLNNIVSIGNAVSVSGGTLTLNSAGTLTIPVLTMGNGTLNGTAPIALGVASVTWTGGTIGGNAAFTIPNGATITAATLIFDGRQVTNNGAFDLTLGNYLYLENNATLANNGTLDILANGNVAVNGATGSISLTNSGLIRKSGGTGVSLFYVPLTAQSGSQLTVNSGQLDAAAVTSTGASFSAASGTTLDFSTGDARSFDASTTISGAGTVEWGAGTNTVNANYNVTGTTIGGGGTTTINNPTSVGNITMINGTLTINSATALTVPALTLQSGTLNGTAPVNLTAASQTWSSGTIGGTGVLTIPAGTTAVVGSVTFDTRPVTNNGTIQLGTTGTPGYGYAVNNAVISNNGSIVFDLDSNLFLNGTQGTTAVVNNGTIEKVSGTGTSNLSVPLTAQPGSQMLVQSGTVAVGQITATGASFAISAGATLSMSYNTTNRTFDAASTISGPGTLAITFGTATVNGTVTAPLNVGNSGTLTINSAAPQSVPTLTLSGNGILNGTAEVDLGASAMTWSGGTIGGTAILSIPNGANVTVSGLVGFDFRTVDNAGTLAIAGANTIHLYDSAVVNNTGAIDLQGDGAIALATGSPVVNNYAMLKKSSGTAVSLMNARVVNQSGGTIEADSGTLKLSGSTAAGGQFIATAAGIVFFTGSTSVQAVSVLSGGTAQNDGTISFASGAGFHMQNAVSFVNTGTIALSGTTIDQGTGGGTLVNRGTITSSGASALTSSADNQTGGTIEVDSGTLAVTGPAFTNSAGTIYFPIASATGFGTINVSGTLTRGATLKARTLSLYNPPAGTTFTIFTFASVSGAFATNDVQFTGGWLVPKYTATTGFLQAAAKKPTATTVVSTQTPALIATAVPFDVTVLDAYNLGGTPAGSVSLSTGVGGETCTATLNSQAAGTCSITFSAVGSRTVTASYGGSTTFDVSSGTTGQQVTGDTVTTIASVSNATPVVGEAVTIHFNVAPKSPAAGTPTGNVTVTDGTANCSSAIDSSGNGSCGMTWMTAGARSLNASYAGDGTYNPSTTAAATSITVAKANTVASITSQSASTTRANESFTVSVSVATASPGSGIPTGSVTVSDGTDSCSGALDSGGNGSCAITLTTVGSRSVTATYAGDANYNASPASASVAHTVLVSCQFTLTPSSAAAPAAGMGGSFNVTANDQTCAWSALGDSPWLATSSSGTGDGSVSFTIGANTLTTARGGSIAVGSQSFSVSQIGVQPSNLVATASSGTSVSLTWSSDAVDHFEVWRNAGAGFAQIASPTAASYTDTNVTAGNVYAYEVRAVDSASNTSAYTNVDLASTVSFADDPLVAGSTMIKAVHVTEIRDAINMVRAIAGLGSASWTDPSLAGVFVKAIHVSEMRSALDPALSALGCAPLSYRPIAAGDTVLAADFQQLRDAMK